MNILKEALDVFGQSLIEIQEFRFNNLDHNSFWTFINNQSKKGVYIFLDMSIEEPENIIYIGKAGKFEKSGQSLKKRARNYFYGLMEKYPKNHKKSGDIIMSNSPINDVGKIEFKKFNSSIDSDELILEKENFKIITIQIIEDKTISPEMLESYLLNKLLKEYKHYPKFNHKI